jgi:hypothetical protein
MLDNAKNYKKYYLAVFGLALLIAGLIGYISGYRIKNNFTLGKVGQVEIDIPLSGTAIFIDESKKIITTKDSETVEIKVSPRNHSFIVSREGYLPWVKKISMPSGEKIKLSPIFIASNASGQIITPSDKEYYTIRNSIVYDAGATKEKPILSEDKTSKLWLDDNAIYVEIGSTTKKVIQPDTIIKNVSFYKNRSDVVIFSNQTAVYALEIETNGIQNFMPIYRGQDPSFVIANENSLYILDNGTLMQVFI